MYNFTQKYRGGFGSDLAIERRKADTDIPGVEFRCEKCAVGTWERVKITGAQGAKSIGKPIGNYDTLNLKRMDSLDRDAIDDAKEETAKELCKIFDRLRIYPRRLLTVGLGNRSLTPDSVGVLSAEEVDTTRYIKSLDEGMFESLECSELSCICPGVYAQTGLSAFEIVSGVCERLKPDAIFAIDAICARSPARLGRTVQFSDTGILPGSGLGRGICELSRRTLGVPVISIGVPTVMNARMFLVEEGEASPASEINGMFVSPKEIDGIVVNAAKIIGGGINQAFGIEC